MIMQGSNLVIKQKVFYHDINIMRASAVLLVVIGHSFKSLDDPIDVGGFIHHFVYQYHMPLFFFISRPFVSYE